VSYFRDKKVLMTGAASGIGRLVAQVISAEGGRLILWDIDAEGLRETADELATDPATYVVDLSRRADIADAAARVLKAEGAVDVLINNAGIVSGKPLLEIADDAIERTFAVNALALFWTTRAFLPAMIRQRSGHIVTIASAAGIAGTARMTDYCASKFAAMGFDDSLRMELKRLKHPVHTTVVCPFYISTGMFEGAKTRFPFLLPIITPEYATRRIVNAIRRRRRRLLMPRLVYTVYLVRLLPVSWYDAVMNFLGVTRSMDDFVGRGTNDG